MTNEWLEDLQSCNYHVILSLAPDTLRSECGRHWNKLAVRSREPLHRKRSQITGTHSLFLSFFIFMWKTKRRNGESMKQKTNRTNTRILLEAKPVSCDCYLRNPNNIAVIWGAALRPVNSTTLSLFAMFQQFPLPVNTSPTLFGAAWHSQGCLEQAHQLTNVLWDSATKEPLEKGGIFKKKKKKLSRFITKSSIFKTKKNTKYIFCTQRLNSVISIHSCAWLRITFQRKQNTFV